jgi:hypothetical protein
MQAVPDFIFDLDADGREFKTAHLHIPAIRCLSAWR